MARNRFFFFLGSLLTASLASSAGAQDALPGEDPPELSEDRPKLAVVIGHTGEASAELARDLQEVMVAALSDREGVFIVGKEELQSQAGFATETEMITCLVDPVCEEDLRTRQNIKILVLGKIDTSETHFEFTIQMIRDTGGEYSKIFRVPQSEGLDGLLEKLFEIAAQLPINEGPIPVVIKDRPDEEQPEEGLGGLGWTGVGVVGLSAASLIAGGIFTVQNQSTGDTLQREISSAQIIGGGAQGITRARGKALEKEANDSAALANIFYGVSLGTALVGGAMIVVDLWVLGGPAEAGANEGGGGAGQVQLTPWVGDEGAGGVLELRW